MLWAEADEWRALGGARPTVPRLLATAHQRAARRLVDATPLVLECAERRGIRIGTRADPAGDVALALLEHLA